MSQKAEKRARALVSELKHILDLEDIEETLKLAKAQGFGRKSAYSKYEAMQRKEREEKLMKQKELHKLLEEMGMVTIEEKREFVKAHILGWNEKRSEYRKKPVAARKDNSLVLNDYGRTDFGKGISERNQNLRYPSKKREGAWKRFMKLFPNLKGSES